MDNKESLWESIVYIREHAPDSGYLDIRKKLSGDLKNEDLELLRRLLVVNGLVRLDDKNQWLFQLTAKGLLLEKKKIKENGDLKKDYSEFIKSVKIASLAAIAGALVVLLLTPLQEWWKEKYLLPPKPNTIVLPKIQLVHDTIPKLKKIIQDTLYLKMIK